MDKSAVVMMIVGIASIWGGFLFSIAHALRKQKIKERK